MEDLSLLSGEEIHAPGSFLVMFNGLILGKHRQPQVLFIVEHTLVFNLSVFSLLSSSCPCRFQKFADTMRMLRRSVQIGEFVSIFVNEKQV